MDSENELLYSEYGLLYSEDEMLDLEDELFRTRIACQACGCELVNPGLPEVEFEKMKNEMNDLWLEFSETIAKAGDPATFSQEQIAKLLDDFCDKVESHYGHPKD